MGRALGEFEQLVLLSLLHLGSDAYGAAIREEIEQRTGREVFVGAVYTALARLEKAGHVASWIGEPTAERGGRRKKFYRLERSGEGALARSWDTYRGMTDGIEAQLEAISRRSS